LISGLNSSDAGHLVYWLAFIPAPILVYVLALRLASRKAALSSALLFASQPLIFGHAFVNPKDTPFMTAILASVWVGLWASDLLLDGDPRPSLHMILPEASKFLRRLITGWKTAPTRSKVVLGFLWCSLLVTAVDSQTSHFFFGRFTWLIRQAYDGQAFWPVQNLFNWAAQDAWKTPLPMYLEKARILYLWTKIPFFFGGTTLLALLSSRVLGSPISLGSIYRTRSYWSWVVAGGMLGLCSAIRVFGPFAGVLVSAYVLLRAKRRAWLPLAAYWSLAVVTLYGAWPSIWRSPLQHFGEAVFRMARFPWEGRVMYEGAAYSVTELPWHYVPRIILFQLTMPAIILGAIGILLALVDITRRRRRTGFLVLLVAWCLVPLAVVVLLDAQIYAAFRQLMFVFPALFILTSIVFDKIFSALRRAVWAPVIVGMAIAPGLVGIARLHPYEMIYYNELVGGIAGASGRFGLGDWGTTYREAIEFIDQVAPEDTLVLVGTREHHTMTPFARDDLQLAPLTTETRRHPPPGSYIVGGWGFPQAEVLYRIEREGVQLQSVIKIPPEDS
jgi:hypothetical protein